MSQTREFTVKPLLMEDREEVLKLLKRTFFVDEPLNKKIQLCPTGECAELEEFCMSPLHEGLSFKAVDNKGKIVGVLINETCPLNDRIGITLFERAEASKDPKFKKILYILAKREEGSRLWEKFPNDDKLVEFKVAATDPDWRNKGILVALVEETEKLLRQRGVRLARLDSSSEFSARAAERNDFTCYYKARYTDIKMAGEPLIVPDPPHVYDRVFVKELF
ncbi:arylalkylamine N-acetyltransferase 1 [Papilio machaon]|uniref:arylalkylamine N-acetyltransferase 1 n=1 Tax=Papilio machaon TaxID=76193 RepID=UPI001E6639F1|nr:arylalkylamine N-acetyltransferase 1 [Papilio machaon]XP_014362335.2 arylalkylamine N-acetyltransferase 1 [Papilio machaon]XP_014362336.2 arylalkylamine N-acetyltransferase 1 [Papilio machaon]